MNATNTDLKKSNSMESRHNSKIVMLLPLIHLQSLEVGLTFVPSDDTKHKLKLKLPSAPSGSVSALSLLEKIEERGFQLNNSLISVYLPLSECYSYLCTFPSSLDDSPSVELPSELFISSNFAKVSLKVRPHASAAKEPKPSEPEQIPTTSKTRRTKERMIEDVIEMVAQWRKIYKNACEGQRLTLEEAARKVGVSKKSLDDYLLQLRLGKKFGFNFNVNRNSKIGVLRNFNKDQKVRRREGKALPGRKRKCEEEDQAEVIENLFSDIGSPTLGVSN